LLLAGLAAAQPQPNQPTDPEQQTPATPAPDQAPAAATTPAPAPTPPPSNWTHWGTDFSLLFDGYVTKNFNNPASGYNDIRNFDFRANSAHLNMGKITIDHAPASVGFHLDVGWGQAFDWIHSTDRAPEAFKYFEQAYVSFKPKAWHGLEIDAGEFVTSAGAEVIETNANWNYSRSLLFSWAIPYYHFGLRASFPIGPHFTGGVQVVQGWNDIYDNNSGKTVGINGAYAWKKATWTNVYYVGPEKSHTNTGIRHLYDTTLQVNPTDHFSYYINFDYGQDKNIDSGSSKWTGIAGAARYTFAKKFAVAGRVEFYDDIDGLMTGTKQKLEEFTLTGEYKMTDWLLSRLEFRNDFSNQYFFEKESGQPGSKTQPTILFGMVAFFGPKK